MLLTQMILPEIELRLQCFTGQPSTLPLGKIRILNRQFRQWRGFATRKGMIEQGQFADKNSGGPAVKYNVVNGDQYHMIGVT